MSIFSLKFALTTLALGIAAVVYDFPPQKYGFYPRCPLYASTHLLCPGCGGTRAFHEMLHFNLAGAWHYNAFLTVLGPLVSLWIVFAWVRAERRNQALEFRVPRTVWVLVAVAALLFTVVRNTGVAFVI